ncbi:N-acetylneuraminate synthase [Pendulispora rubella]|uniref:N-acetylneuraminate synthase n=1 Tax=Pendulispora rubella TaxID=2741070 RepID=A0ABZ2LF38_9BACT
MTTTSAVFVIAEAGVNHNGRLDLALELVDTAARAGADAIKFQTFRAESLATRSAAKAEYQEKATGKAGSQLDMLRALELDEEAHRKVVERCQERRIEFMSTPFDVDSVGLLTRLGVKRFKVPSGEIDNPLLLRAIAQQNTPVILSTGMATLAEVEGALGILTAAWLGQERPGKPGLGQGPESLWSDRGKVLVAERVTLLHCTSLYPAPAEAVNLRAMQTMRDAFETRVGYSDHTLGVGVSAAAVALGATVIEKHFTLDRTMEGPDHKASLEPEELVSFVAMLRDVALSLGSARKMPTAAEVAMRAAARRSLVAATPIRKGEAFTAANVALKRPGTGMSGRSYDALLGRTASRDYAEDDLIKE